MGIPASHSLAQETILTGNLLILLKAGAIIIFSRLVPKEYLPPVYQYSGGKFKTYANFLFVLARFLCR